MKIFVKTFRGKISHEKIDTNVNLVEGETFKLKDIDKSKDDFIQLILDVFKEEADNSF